MAKKKSTDSTLKTYFLGIKITEGMRQQLEKRKTEHRDSSISHTARKILMDVLDGSQNKE